jgi:16S rRNA (adenine1518-N6/adenine1519-N6)-dimethyltransferase
MVKRRRPKLGQHFLSDPRYCSRIADALELRPDDLVIEIGPGRGAMTGLLAERTRNVVAIEIDSELAGELRRKFQQEPRVEIIRGDILRTDIKEICRRYGVDRCYVFGNLPYYITSPIIHHVLGCAANVRAMGILVQREVANRLAAEPGSRDYGYLTVYVQLYTSPRVVLQVPPGAFSPPPQVYSSLVRFDMRPEKSRFGVESEKEFIEFLKQSFAHKRKKLLNCLSPVYSRQKLEQEFERLCLPPAVRAEQLSLDQLAAIFLVLQHN